MRETLEWRYDDILGYEIPSSLPVPQGGYYLTGGTPGRKYLYHSATFAGKEGSTCSSSRDWPRRSSTGSTGALEPFLDDPLPGAPEVAGLAKDEDLQPPGRLFEEGDAAVPEAEPPA